MRSQLVKTVNKLIKEDDRVVLLLGDIGVFGFRESLKNYPKRAYNVGILEQSTISLASGLAMCGLIPIVHTIAPFLVERSFEQIKIDLCYQELGANLVSVGASYDYAALGPTHHCPGDVAVLNQIPGIEIVMPGHPDEFDKLFRSNYNNERATYYRLSSDSNAVPYDVTFGKNVLVREGKKLLVIAVGTMLQTVMDALHGLDVTIIYCTTIKPFDTSFIEQYPGKKIVIIEPYYSGVLLTNILRQTENVIGNFTSIGVPNDFINKYGKKEDIDKLVGLDKKTIRQKVMEKVNE